MVPGKIRVKKGSSGELTSMNQMNWGVKGYLDFYDKGGRTANSTYSWGSKIGGGNRL